MSGINSSMRVAEDFAVLSAGAHNLLAIEGKPQGRCVRRIWTLAATTFSVMANHAGVSAAPPVEIPAFEVIDADISAITFTGGPVWVGW